MENIEECKRYMEYVESFKICIIGVLEREKKGNGVEEIWEDVIVDDFKNKWMLLVYRFKIFNES